MADKTRLGDKFQVTKINRLPQAQRLSPLHRTAVACRKNVNQCEFVLDRLQQTVDVQTARRDAAAAALEAARNELDEAAAALAKAS